MGEAHALRAGDAARHAFLGHFEFRAEPDARNAHALRDDLQRRSHVEHVEHGDRRRIADDGIRRGHRDPVERARGRNAETLATEAASILDRRAEPGRNDPQMPAHGSALSVSTSNTPSSLAACMSS